MALQFLHRLREWFGRGSNKGPTYRDQRKEEKALLDEIGRIISDTKTKIPQISGYRRRLETPVRVALNKIDGMIAHIPGPIALASDLWGTSPVLRAVFTSPDALRQWVGNCTTLQEALKQNPESELYGLLVAEYNEKTSLGVELVGDIIQKDVLQRSVYFEEPQIVAPQTDLENARKALRHRILVVLFTRELEEIADLKAVTEELEKQQEILKVKLWHRDKQVPERRIDDETVKEARKIINDIDHEIEKIGRHPDTPESHLKHVTDVLMNIERHLAMTPFAVRLNNLGIRVKASSTEPYDEIHFAECTFTGGHKRSVIWVKINRSSFGR